MVIRRAMMTQRIRVVIVRVERLCPRILYRGPSNFRSDLESYRVLLAGLNANTATVTPSTPARCHSRP